MLEIENDNLKAQVNTTRHQYRELLSENESLKKEVYSYKERSLEAENDLRTSQMTVDKMQIEINQLREALSRTERLLDKERKKKAELMIQSPSSLNATVDFSRADHQRYEEDYSTRDYPEPNYQSSRRYEAPYPTRKEKDETQYKPKERDYKDKKAEYVRDLGQDYPVDKGSGRKERETENKYSEYEAKKSYDTYQASYRSSVPESGSKDLQKNKAATYQPRTPFYVEEENSKNQNEERERRSRLPEKKNEPIKNERSPDYVSKYEQQFQKVSNKNSSSIIFGDPSLYNEKQPPARTSYNKTTPFDQAAGDFRGRVASPPKDKYSTIQNPALKPTKGLLDWQENTDADNDSKAKKREGNYH